MRTVLARCDRSSPGGLSQETRTRWKHSYQKRPSIAATVLARAMCESGTFRRAGPWEGSKCSPRACLGLSGWREPAPALGVVVFSRVLPSSTPDDGPLQTERAGDGARPALPPALANLARVIGLQRKVSLPARGLQILCLLLASCMPAPFSGCWRREYVQRYRSASPLYLNDNRSSNSMTSHGE